MLQILELLLRRQDLTEKQSEDAMKVQYAHHCHGKRRIFWGSWLLLFDLAEPKYSLLPCSLNHLYVAFINSTAVFYAYRIYFTV